MYQVHVDRVNKQVDIKERVPSHVNIDGQSVTSEGDSRIENVRHLARRRY